MKRILEDYYKKLFSRFGPQYWWPGDTPLEVMIGAVLTQNTNWKNAALAIDNLKRHEVLDARKLYRLPQRRLASLLRPAGYYNIKARRLKNLLEFFIREYAASVSAMRSRSLEFLRGQLLGVNGIGQETADSILLYALDKPIFVVDSYTRRILVRHNLQGEDADYQGIQRFFMQNLKKEVKLFNEYHALLVRVGKDYCLKKKGRCEECPLK